MIKWILIVAILISSLWPSFTVGQERLTVILSCAPVSTAEDSLWRGYREERVAEGKTDFRGILGELWLSKGGESWTFMLRIGEKALCVVGAGRDWYDIENNVPILGREGR